MRSGFRYLVGLFLRLNLALFLAHSGITYVSAQIAAPTIAVQPQSLTINPGNAGSLTVTANGTGALSYRWFKEGVALVDGAGRSGTSAATLAFAAAQASDGGSYQVIVSNSGGSLTSVAASVTVAVIFAPVITSVTAVTAPPSVAFNYAIAATNGPTGFIAVNMPPGLTLNSGSGIIAGVPTVPGIYSVVLGATNANGTGNATLTLTVEAELPSYADKLVTGATGNSTVVAGKLSSPAGLAVDSAGTVFVADAGAHTIAKITAAGVLSIVAGQVGQGGSSEGVGTAASFLSPGGVAVDPSGNLFVADTGNHTIRKIAVDGTVSTLAGAVGQAGSADGAGAVARFFSPRGIVADRTGTIYVADTANHTLRKITPTGEVTTLAGSAGLAGVTDGTGHLARFNLPNSVAVDATGAIYVTEEGNNSVRKVTAGGAVTTLAGSYHLPAGIAVDPTGNIFVSDTGNNTIKEITAVGTRRTLPMNGVVLLQAPPSLPMAFPTIVTKPRGLACDAEGNFYWFNEGGSLAAGLHKAVPFFPVAISSPPVSQTATAGTNAQFSVSATGSPLNYAWYGPGLHKVGGGVGQISYLSTAATQTVAASLVPEIFNVSTNAGTYGVFVYNIGSWARATAELSVTPPPPRVLAQPVSVDAVSGQRVTFTMLVNRANSFNGSLTYEWRFNDVPIPNATNYEYPILHVQASDAGRYSVKVTETSLGGVNSVTSVPATLTVGFDAPVIATAPRATAVYAGNSVTLRVTASGAGLSYQWRLNGVPVPGATEATLTLPDAQLAGAGSYTVVVSNLVGSVTSAPAAVEVITTRLANLSARGSIRAGNTLIVGFVTRGSASKQLLIRGIGPTLNSFGITGMLTAPELRLFNAVPASIAVNTGWGGTARLTASFARVGAFPLPADSADAAWWGDLASGLYSAQVSGRTGLSGIALAEIYDDDEGTPASRLINLSARGFVGTGDEVLIAGFVIEGNRPCRVLLRGIGPTLGRFAVTGALAEPQLTLFDAAGKILASNTGWKGEPALNAAFAQVGAFSLASSSTDSALIATLPPGSYTTVVSGADEGVGSALVEVYEFLPE